MDKKRLAIINSYNCGSTGKIACAIGDYANEDGYNVLKCFPRHTINIDNKQSDQFLFGSPFLFAINAYLTEITGLHGFFQIYNTIQLVKRLNDFKPDIVHLHNLHSAYVNLKMLINYLNKSNVVVVWTLHDCWAFTGHCAYFTISGCEKWKTGCYKCYNHAKEYPKALIDMSSLQWKKKNKLFNSISNLTLVTPSLWLNRLVKKSFLKEKKSVVIYNGIDLSTFKPTYSDIRQKYHISVDQIIILGVAFGWNYRKGLDVFIELSRILPKEYQIVLVGTNSLIDEQLPENIISIHRTHDQKELAEIYTAADIFLNPTREEMLGMTNIEANACGTPVITFNTGGSPECINDKSGYVFMGESVSELAIYIQNIIAENNSTVEECLENSKRFNATDRFGDYVKLFNSLI